MPREVEPENPDGFWGGILFLIVIFLTAVAGVAQLAIAKQYNIMGFTIIVIAGLFTAFLVRVARSPRAGENSSEEKK